MTDAEDIASSEADTEAMFATIGRYLVIFQWIEGKLDQILLLAWGFENCEANQSRLAKMSNFEKTCALRDIVLASPDFSRIHTRTEWRAGFEILISRLHEERSRRNVLVHSQYLFELVAAGLPPLQSHRMRNDGKATFHQQSLTRSTQKQLLDELVRLAADVSHTHVQLVHDYKAHIKSE